MKSKLLFYVSALIGSALLGACMGDVFTPKEDPTKFYVLNSPVKVESIDGLNDISVNIAPVKIPEYMLRQQILIQKGSRNEIDLSDTNRWLEYPNDAFSRVVALNLSRITGSDDVCLYPYVSENPNAYMVRIVVARCAGELGGDMNFIVRWHIFRHAAGKPAQKYGNRFFRTYKTGANYEEYVNTISEAFYDLSLEIAKELKKLYQSEKNADKPAKK